MMNYDTTYNFWGMHFVWWFIWLVFIIWIFATPYQIRGKKAKNDTPLDILKKRFALGEINKDEFLEMKDHLE